MFKRFGRVAVAVFLSVILLFSTVWTVAFVSAEATTLFQGFESDSIFVSGTPVEGQLFMNSGFSQYPAAGDVVDTSNIKSGSKSLYHPIASGTQRTSLITQGMELVVGQTYRVELWLKVVSGQGDFEFTQITTRSNGATVSGSTVKPYGYINSSTFQGTGTFVKETFTFTATQKYFGLSTYGIEFYLDDITVTPIPSSVTVKIEANNGENYTDLTGAPGGALTLPTLTKSGYYFVGWYSDSGFTTPLDTGVFPDADITAYAKWEENGTFVQDFENFTNTGSNALSNAEIYNTATGGGQVLNGNNSLHGKSGNIVAVLSPVKDVKLTPGKSYELSANVWVPSTTSAGAIEYTLVSTYTNGWSYNSESKGGKLTGYLNTADTNALAKMDKWETYTVKFTVPEESSYLYFGIYSYGVSDYYIDDVTVKEIATVTVTPNTNGGGEVDPISGPVGSELTVPNPTAPEGKVFEGWYSDPELTVPFVSTVFPATDTQIYANYVDAGKFEQGFEKYNNTGSYALSNAEVYNTATGGGQVKTGSYSLHGISGNVFAVLTPNSALTLIPGTSYKMTADVWVPSTSSAGAIQYTLLSQYSNAFTHDENKGKLTSYINYADENSRETMDKWTSYETYFYIPENFTNLYVGIYGYGLSDYYIDNVVVEEVKTVTISFETNGGVALESLVGGAGQGVTLPSATPPEGMAFAGWYSDAELTVGYSSTVFPADDITLYAKYTVAGQFQQDFENYSNTSKDALSNMEIYDSATGEGQVSSGTHSLKGLKNNAAAVVTPTSTMKLIPGESYKISASIWVPSTMSENGGQIDFTLLTNYTNAWTYDDQHRSKLSDYLNPNHEPSRANMDKWTTYERYFYVPADSTNLYVGIYSWGVTDYYIDDISVEKVKTVTVTLETNGGSTIEPLIGAAGQELSITAPTPPEGKSFAGWYQEAELKNTFLVSNFPEDDITLYARYIDAGTFEQDFEQWNWEPNSNAQTSPFSIYTATSEDDTNVYNGSHSMYYDSDNGRIGGTFALTMFDNTMGSLQIGEKYTMTVRIKLNETEAGKYSTSKMGLSIYNTSQSSNAWSYQSQGAMGGYYAYAFYYDTISDDYWYGTANQFTASTEKDENGWFTMTYEFTAVTPYIALYCYNGFDFSYWIDAISIKPLPTGTVDENYSDTYCEEFYNVLNKNDEVSALDTNEKVIQKIELTQRGDYIFAASLKTGRLGNPKVYLAWDSEGKNKIEGTEFVGTGSVFQRFAVRFVTDSTGVVYLVTEGGGADSYEKVVLFERKFAQNEDPNSYYVRPAIDYDTLPVKTAAEEVLVEDDLNGTENDGYSDTEVAGDTEDMGESPETGDNTSLALIFIILAFAVSCLTVMRKRGTENE